MELKISDRIHYIGVNDRSAQPFESLWPIPSGISYNSYIVVGDEKTAIIDGVHIDHALSQVHYIHNILGDRQPDYLIINHMEPDHSGSIELLRKMFPGITIVGNTLTMGMVQGYYGITDNTLAIKDGDQLTLGSDTTLAFYMIPMVHWPETMVTYLSEEKTMFSGDAFGCYGALNGCVLDSDMNAEPYFPEMVRYYSNIVGKYGRFVQRAISHTAQLDLHTICPTHGPVWRKHLPHVVDIYDKLSRYQPLDEGATIVYGSMYGNTLRMAEAVAQGLASAGVKDISMHNASVSDLSFILSDIFRHKRLVLAAPTYSDTLYPPMAALIEALTTRGIANRRVAIVGSYTWAPKAMKIMSDAISGLGLEIVGTPMSVKQSPGSDALADCRNLGALLAQ